MTKSEGAPSSAPYQERTELQRNGSLRQRALAFWMELSYPAPMTRDRQCQYTSFIVGNPERTMDERPQVGYSSLFDASCVYGS